MSDSVSTAPALHQPVVIGYPDHKGEQIAIPASDIAEIIAFTLSRPRRLAINEILVRPANQG